MNYERESAWLMVGIGGAVVFVGCMALAGAIALSAAFWSLP